MGFSLQAQYIPLQSQYILNGVASNPSLTGDRDVLSVLTSYRNQWVGFEGAPVTQSISVHTPLKNEKIALGALFYRDVISKHRESGFYMNYAYRIKMNTGRLSFGIGAGAVFRKSNLAEAIVIDSGDEVYSENIPLNVIPNFSVGINYQTNKFFAGVSLPRVLSYKLDHSTKKNKISDSYTNYNLRANLGYNFNLNESIKLKPSVLLRYHSVSGYQFDINPTFEYKDIFGVGISYRYQDAVVALLKVKINEQMIIGYSYDYSISELMKYNDGSHEIVLRYDFKYKVKTASPRFF